MATTTTCRHETGESVRRWHVIRNDDVRRYSRYVTRDNVRSEKLEF